jgi:hypothetical protein
MTAILAGVAWLAVVVFMGGALVSLLSRPAGTAVIVAALVGIILVLWGLVRIWRREPTFTRAPSRVDEVSFASLPDTLPIDAEFEDWLAEQEIPGDIPPRTMAELRLQFGEIR